MANEYLKRTPTSSGNRKVWTWASWFKLNETTPVVRWAWLFNTSVNGGILINYGGTPYDSIISWYDNAAAQSVFSKASFRDINSWYHLVVNYDSTLAEERERVRFYMNGQRLDYTTNSNINLTFPSQNFEANWNDTIPHSIGRWELGSSRYIKAQYLDQFFVDGQALTPDVFGFYKDGDGYQSSGTTNSTDFKPGQWSPRLPKSIKYTINRSGGFGVNGYYLPMNDSSNPGADFHCAPNSIIKLKGEDLPQPQNGAPITSDAYVSQLRTDANAANLVLAVPGIALENTNTELVTNGDFSNGTTGWTGLSGGSLSVEGDRLKITETTNALDAYAVNSTAITTVVGTRYTIKWTFHEGTNTTFTVRFGNSGNQSLAYLSNSDSAGQFSDPGTYSFDFEATATQLNLSFIVNQANSYGYISNVSVKEALPVRDYSADIKGSGTNKTLTATGNAGVGYELGGYYGSAMTFDGTGDFLSIPNNLDFNFSSGGDFTIELWLYRKNTGGNDAVIGVFENSSDRRAWQLEQRSNEALRFQWWTTGSGAGGTLDTQTSAVPIDQWTHICAERNGDSVTLYINGVASAVDTSASSFYNNTIDPLRIGVLNAAGDSDLNGNIQDVRIYKGLAKYKGGFDVPKPYTPVGIEAFRTTADTCKNNFATLNPLYPRVLTSGTDRTFSNGNLTGSTLTNGVPNLISSMGVSYGQKRYFEVRQDSRTGGTADVGFIGVKGIGQYDNPSDFSTSTFYYGNSGTKYKYVNGATTISAVAYGDTYTDGDIIGISIDSDGTVVMYKNGVSQGTIDTYTEAQFPLFLILSDGSSAAVHTYTVNFGQNPTFSGVLTAGTFTDDSGKGLFKYAPPSGFLALCEDNLPTPAIADPGKHFKSVLYTGDGTNGRSITGLGFKPDFVWTKERSSNSGHFLLDSVRGVTNYLSSHSAAIEGTATGALNSFDPSGYSIGNSGAFNESSQTYVAWCWKAGGAAVSNTDGTITSQVSVNQTAGFSIATWTSTGSNDALQTVGHGLDTAPNMIILKNRSAAVNWRVYHSGIPSPNNSLCLNTTEVAFNFFPSVGDDTFGLANSTTTGQSSGASGQDIVAYCWTEIEGFSKFGSYVGNLDAEGPFVYCGFKPAWVLLKIASPSGQERDWHIYDSSRNPTNPVGLNLRPSTNVAEIDEPGIDFVSNGFKIRQSYVFSNYNGGTFIFAAFAESPFQTANAK